MELREEGRAKEERKELWLKEKQLRLLVLFIVLGIIVTALLFRDRFTDVEHTVRTLGYPAIFVIALIGAGGIVVPLPSTAAIFLGGAFLTPVFVGLLAGVAEAMGEITGYALGYTGRGLLEKSSLYGRVERWLRRRGWVAILVFAIIPNPIFDLVGVAAGVLRFPVLRFLMLAWIGKSIKDVGLAYAGFLGTQWVKDVFGGS